MEADDPAEQLVSFVRSFEQNAEAVLAVQPSCLFVSFIYETELADAGTDTIVAESILHWRARILDKLERATSTRSDVPGGGPPVAR